MARIDLNLGEWDDLADIPHFVAGDFPSWIAVGVGGVALVLAWRALRPPQTRFHFLTAKAIRSAGGVNLVVRFSAAPHGTSFILDEVRTKVVIGPQKLSPVPTNLAKVRGVYQGAHDVSLEYSLDHLGEALSEGRLTLNLSVLTKDGGRLNVKGPVMIVDAAAGVGST